ncbi:hypothetical protein D0T25_07640 [Duganella sp. BJB488]|nr:hypothetical protein D0T26_08210 [Duganella sp. BJB489]RFP24918.1 hypothetical protein D0T25_07640 [Duganella sp. BJB488]RFP34005.1 hypothetical protein D0T24_16590 [Duganella sp. BJB480]
MGKNIAIYKNDLVYWQNLFDQKRRQTATAIACLGGILKAVINAKYGIARNNNILAFVRQQCLQVSCKNLKLHLQCGHVQLLQRPSMGWDLA